MTVGDADPTARGAWPELPWRDWEPTISTLHRWVQVVGKVRTVLSPPINHWWHSTLSITPRGFTTTSIPVGRRAMEIRFDFIDHELVVDDSDGATFVLPLEPMSVARFYRDVMAGLKGLGVDVEISTKPNELVDATPFDVDETHASYDRSHAELHWRALLEADRVMKSFQSGFIGKQSPVQLFWGSFDLAASRYRGRPAPRYTGSAVNCPEWVMEEAYSAEESAAGWWAQFEPPGPAFYAYTSPQPEGIAAARVLPAAATWEQGMGLFMLPYDAVRELDDPDAAVLEFLESTYAAGADLAGWDRAHLEPARRPGPHQRGPWSVLT